MKVWIVVRTPVKGGDFFIEGVWLDRTLIEYKIRKHYYYDVLEMKVKEKKKSKKKKKEFSKEDVELMQIADGRARPRSRG